MIIFMTFFACQSFSINGLNQKSRELLRNKFFSPKPKRPQSSIFLHLTMVTRNRNIWPSFMGTLPNGNLKIYPLDMLNKTVLHGGGNVRSTFLVASTDWVLHFSLNFCNLTSSTEEKLRRWYMSAPPAHQRGIFEYSIDFQFGLEVSLTLETFWST